MQRIKTFSDEYRTSYFHSSCLKFYTNEKLNYCYSRLSFQEGESKHQKCHRKKKLNKQIDIK